MRVRILNKTGYSNPRRGIQLKYGEVADVPEGVAEALLRNRLAEPAPAEPKKVETAEAAPPENTAKRTTKPSPKARKSSRPATEEGTE